MSVVNPLHLFGLTALAALWGAPFLFIHMAVPAFGSFVRMELHVLLGGGALWVLAVSVRRRAAWLSRWKEYLVPGTVNAALPFSLIAAAEMVIPASFAAMLNALTPVFTALVSALWLRQRIGAKLAVGLAVASAGLIVSVG